MKAARTRALNKKHAGTGKHHHTAKHTGTATRHAAKAHKQVAHRVVHHSKAAHLRAWSPDEEFAVCSARAVAESLRLALGVRLADEDVLALHWAAGGDPDAGASILDVLTAAQQFAEKRLERDRVRMHPVARMHFDESLAFVERCPVVIQGERNRVRELIDGQFRLGHPLIIGLDLPYGEPHAVVAHNGAWWSWGEPYDPADFPGAVIEEAWAVTWS